MLTAMYCPLCGAEYGDGYSECSECHVALVPEATESRPDLAVVFESNDPFAIALAKASLEDAAVPFWTQGDENAARLGLSPIMFPLCRFLVPRKREEEATKLLSALQQRPRGKGITG